MKNLPLILFFFASFNSQAQNSFLFPNDCLGRYSGTMYIEYIGKGIVDSAHVELEFSKTDKDFEWNYFNTIENERYGKIEKRYTLIQDESKKGLFILDENNGIQIEHTNIGRNLYSTFEVQGNLIFYNLECIDNQTLYYKILTSDMNKLKESNIQSDGEEEQILKVNSYLPFTSQYVTLKKY
ncbi:MAG: hypothetical protein P8P48_13665 [Saprospiraceae bacterium]|nr:hypothetical protein [Saprospiraceae bacterium]